MNGCHAFAAEFRVTGPRWVPPRKHAYPGTTSCFRGKSQLGHEPWRFGRESMAPGMTN
jgi:hypothetical protein